MAEPLTDAEEQALYGDPSRRTPVDLEVAPDPGLLLRVRFSGQEQADLHRAIGPDANPFEFIRETTMERDHELLAASEDADGTAAAD